MSLRRCKFTLLEVITAVAIMAFVSTIVASALMGFQRSYNRVSKLSMRLERNQKMDKVANMMRNTIPFFWPDADEDDREKLVFDGQSDELWFTAMQLPGPDTQGGMIFVRLYLNDDNQLACDYRNHPFLPWIEMDDQENYRTAILADNVESLTMLYGDYDDDGEVEWLEEWDQEDADYENRLPIAVQFTVEFSDGEKIRFLRRTAGISAYSGLVD